ncbi:TlyA family RNA methyltransferase [Acholeplasma vituli]|uniref:TlyA family RNA methyltransferase n=1 Tax=Paracholeplasma vituli TaxID=69473 RepID=A0ABT2PVV7_9MOLU|nr:TlyA family RNA methyltransferase [Paracholeplasma vituli]MCU0104975.1 TlyA family RNA methyltransferase [Paracholeplasma vituli]
MRLDHYMVEAYQKTRSQVQDLIKQGKVMVGNQIITKTGYELKDEVVILIEDNRYVSRGGLKLLDAITAFQLDFKDVVVCDIGSSTGGFTDCALQHGAKKVYAYDVGSNQMHDSLRHDPRVILHEQTNILSVTLPTDIQIYTVDVSFTSVKPILNYLQTQTGTFIILVKPQFEVGPEFIKDGIVKDPKKQKDALDGIISYAKHLGFIIKAHKTSDLLGKMGNQEFLLYATK